ncbi:hypothetical protein GX563_04505 [Candidatus Bathyarchaeota archaeon]|nr:hypothetical protein [Candidatus Bathyarchaeota archaeon]
MEAKTTLRIPDFMKPILEDIRLLRSDGNNPNRMTNKQKEELWKSLEEFGWTDPILTNQDGVFTDGEQRVSVCIAHGEFYAPVYRMSDLSEAQRRRLRLIANELKGKHNKEQEEEEWQRIIKLGQREELKSFLDSIGEKLPETLRDDHEKVSIIPETYELIVECKDEADQKAKLEELQAKSWKVRVLNL